MSARVSSGERSRARILERVRAATGQAAGMVESESSSWAALPRGYIRRGTLSAEGCVELMIHRLREYDAEVTECEPAALAATIATVLERSGRRRMAAPAGLPREWRAGACEWMIDGDLTTAEIEQTEGVVTACFCGVADSGTIVLHHSQAEGRRVLSLLPDWHVCILRANQVVETLPEYFSRCEEPPALVTWISGPSATADIEMTRIKGVHGPRFLHVILVRNQGEPAVHRAGNELKSLH
ncbi:MAG TPA: LUD domain-containing protein [Terracidiphilus sp.]